VFILLLLVIFYLCVVIFGNFLLMCVVITCNVHLCSV